MNRKKPERIGHRVVRLLLVASTGGVVFESCVTRFGDAVVVGTKNYISSILSPEFLADLQSSSSLP